MLHTLSETDIFGFRTPCAWISLDLEVSLEGSALLDEPSVAAATASLEAASGREPGAVVLFLFLPPNSIGVPVKNRKTTPNPITWEYFFSLSPLVHVIFIGVEGSCSCRC